MPALESESYRRWEQEVREASRRGLEGILAPASEWPSFLQERPAAGEAEAFDFPAGPSLEKLMEAEAPAGGAAPAEAPAPADAAPGPAQELPESRLPENLREEIEGFLNRDRSAPASEDEIKAYLKGGIDPNVEPES